MTTVPELRTYAASLELVATGRPYRWLEGRAVPYETWTRISGLFGDFDECHARGSFRRTTKTGAGKRLPLLLFHNNRDWPAGHIHEWRDEDDGLYGVWQLNETAEAQKAAKLAEAGDLTGLSIGFSDGDREPEIDYEADPPRIRRLESRLHEVSLTPTPAFAEAEVMAVRCRSAGAGRPPTPTLDHWRALAADLHSA